MPRVLRIGHRGAAGRAPENTLASLEKAIALGADLVEFDVQRTRDGYLVLIHDKTVDRTTDGTGSVSRMTLATLRTLHAGDGQRVPTLEEALQVANGRVGLIPEIKAEGIGEQVAAAVRHSGFSGPVIYASFHHPELLSVRRAEPSPTTMALFKKLPKQPIARVREAKAASVGLRRDTVTERVVDMFHAAGLRVFVYTVNEPSDIQRMRALKVDGIISDFPERI